jgi:hypothetical protein
VVEDVAAAGSDDGEEDEGAGRGDYEGGDEGCLWHVGAVVCRGVVLSTHGSIISRGGILLGFESGVVVVVSICAAIVEGVGLGLQTGRNAGMCFTQEVDRCPLLQWRGGWLYLQMRLAGKRDGTMVVWYGVSACAGATATLRDTLDGTRACRFEHKRLPSLSSGILCPTADMPNLSTQKQHAADVCKAIPFV